MGSPALEVLPRLWVATCTCLSPRLNPGVEGRVLPGLWSSLLCMKPRPLGEPPRPALGWRMSWRGKPKARPPRPKQRANTSAVLGAPLASRVRARVVLCGVRLGGQ